MDKTNTIQFPLERSLARSGEPYCHDSDGKLMQWYAVSYQHAGKTWGLSICAYSDEDAEARVKSMSQGLVLDGRVVASGFGDPA